MNTEKQDKPMGAGGYALSGAGVGAAGAGSTMALLGAATGIAVLPVTIVFGVVGGLVWWAVKSVAE